MRQQLINFFLYFRTFGEDNIGMSIEQFVDKYISETPSGDGWVRVEDGFPEDNIPVLAYQENKLHPECEIQVLACRDGEFIDIEDILEPEVSGVYVYITHWRPLPSPPPPQKKTINN